VPLYASSLGASWTEIGLMGTSYGTTAMLLALVSGKISDRLGRKPLLLGSATLGALAALLYLVTGAVWQLIAVRILEGVAWAFFWPAVEAVATEIVEPIKAGRAMGMVTASYGIAFASGSLVGGSIVDIMGFAQTFASYLGLSVVSVLAALYFLHETRPQKPQHVAHGSENDVSSSMQRSETLLLAYFLGGTYTFGLGIVLSLFSVFAKNLGVALVLIGVLFGIFWLGRIIGSFEVGRLCDRYGRKPFATAGMTGSALGFALVAASTRMELLLVAVAVLGVSLGALFPTSIALISDSVHQSKRGYAMGIFETACAAGFMLASTFGGYLADLYSPRTPYVLATITSVASAVILSWKLRESKTLLPSRHELSTAA